MKRVEQGTEESKRQRLALDCGAADLTYHQETDYFGLKINLLKSQMQKCVRRGHAEQAVYALASMANMTRLFPGQSRAPRASAPTR